MPSACEVVDRGVTAHVGETRRAGDGLAPLVDDHALDPMGPAERRVERRCRTPSRFDSTGWACSLAAITAPALPATAAMRVPAAMRTAATAFSRATNIVAVAAFMSSATGAGHRGHQPGLRPDPAAAWAVASIHADGAASAMGPIARCVPVPAAEMTPRAPADPRGVRGPVPAGGRTVRDGQAKLAGGLLVGQAFEVAKDDRGAEPLEEPVELRVQLRTDLPRHVRSSPARLHLGPPSLDCPPVDRAGPRLDRDLPRHAEEPARHRAGLADRAGPLRQDQERRLRGVLGVVQVGHRRNGNDAQHHRPAPLHRAAANAAAESSSPRPVRYRRSNSPSATAPSAPAPKRVRRCRDATVRCSLVMVMSSSLLGSGFDGS